MLHLHQTFSRQEAPEHDKNTLLLTFISLSLGQTLGQQEVTLMMHIGDKKTQSEYK